MTFDELWTKFWEWTNGHPAGRYFFRGQADNSPIKPKIGRPEYAYKPGEERALFKAFERGAYPFVNGRLSNYELLALAQHHGCPTRLVDWSTSPLVAAWFAVSSYPLDKEAQIYALDLAVMDTIDTSQGKMSSGGTVTDPLELTDGVYLIETAQVSSRIKTQRGIFTLHGNPTVAFPIPDADTFKIPVDLRDAFQSRLMDNGIDASHIFPDIDGLCKSLDWRLKSGKLTTIA